MKNINESTNLPILTSDFSSFLAKISRSKKTFCVGLILFVIALFYGCFHMFFEDKKTINKVLLARESMLNAALTKAENKKDILEAEVLLLNEEVKSLIREKDKNMIKKISKYLTDTDVSGKGLEIILNDNKSPLAPVQNDSVIIHNTDLLKIVNFLWQEEAGAISINNERIASNTSVSCIGATILINKKRINAPFKIQAVGEKLQSEKVKNSSVVLSLVLRGIDVEINEIEHLRIPPAKYTTLGE